MIDILREIGMIDRALDSIANIEFKQIDLARGQYLYVVRIYEHPGIISEQLSNLIKVDRTTIARAVKKLEKNGEITEDELRSLTEEIQKVTDQHVAKIDTLTKEKEKEIMEV